MRDPNKFTVGALRELLTARGLPIAGTKAELIARLMEDDPSGFWMSGDPSDDNDDSEDPQQIDTMSAQPTTSQQQREIDLCRREKELAERELAVTRLELEAMRKMLQIGRPIEGDRLQQSEHGGAAPSEREQARTATDNSGRDIVNQIGQRQTNITAVADLLGIFDGTSSDYETWEKQIKLIKSTYRLEDNAIKILVGMRLKGKALEWFHSKAEHIEMTFDRLLDELKAMFYRRQSKLVTRKKFEERMWKRDETFHEYFHEKVIMGNRVPIGEDEVLEYVIDGIPDETLRNQARIQRFTTTDGLLEAFERVTLRDRSTPNTSKPGKPDRRVNDQNKSERREAVNTGENKKSSVKITRCYNCGERNHVSLKCPTKNQGAKCFRCGERGHIASKCAKQTEANKESCAVSEISRNKYVKNVLIDGREIEALIDSGSDFSLMRADEYIKLGSPRLCASNLLFDGVGSSNNATLGKFQAELTVDGYVYPICVHIVSDTMLRHKLLIGTDFLGLTDVNLRGGKVTICPLSHVTCSDVKNANIVSRVTDDAAERENVPEIFRIEVIYDGKRGTNFVDVSHIQDFEQQIEIENLVDNYKPNKTLEPEVTMKLVLKDEEPVYQSARRLSASQQEIVNAQIEQWIADGIAIPSTSEFASPVVLVVKKDGSYRLCVDYRLINKKIVKDRYPLPLVEDQLDMLQGARIFSTIDLKNGFFHVRIDESSRKYTAFIVPSGHYEFLRVPFGLCNSPAVFQRFVNTVFKDLIREKIVLAYMDDLIVPSSNIANGIESLKRVLATASEAGLIINWKKCCLLQTSVEFLGHIISDGCVRPSDRKTDAVRRFPQPTNVKQVQSFLGLSGYFRKFVPSYSTIARPLSNLLRANVKFRFGVAEKNAFMRLKAVLSEKPVLNLYRIEAETELHTDASTLGYGAILLQRNNEDQRFHPVYYSSGKTTSAEANYSSYELEVLAIIKALRKFRVYLLGIAFTIVTDCRAFTLTMNKRDLCVRVARWALLLEEFNYRIEHRPGKNMVHVDALSRNPLSMCLVIEESEAGLTARLRRAQEEDDSMRKLRDLVLQNKMQGYVIRGGLLYKDSNGDIQLVVPRGLQTQIIRRAHEHGHFSVGKTEDLVRADYWIPNLRQRVEQVVRNCVACILAERKPGKQECMLQPIEKGSVSLDTLHIDHLGPLPSTKKSYQYIFVVVDAFSKFVWLYATKSTSTAEVLVRLKKQAAIFCNPRRIISDRGTAFTSHDFRDYCREENIEHTLTTTGIPRANGQVERFNRTLLPLLTKLAAPKPNEWYKYLELAQQYLNSTMHRSIGTSPFHLLFGAHPRLKDRPDIREYLTKEWIASFESKRDELRAQASENIGKIQRENKRNFDKNKRKATIYREGDLVAIKRTQQGPGLKVAHKYFGPYEVIRVLRGQRYLVQKIGEAEGPQRTSTSADFMKLWITDENNDSSEDEDGYGVDENIRGECIMQDGRV